MSGDTEASSHVPQLRALLFTDLCDSTSLVERIGDSAAAELFQHHDRLVLAMQQRWRGQQIDRSDGLFLLFERPADALGFALDYQQALRQLGQTNRIALLARAGLHVGEVILWNNSAEAIALGSKPVEVEGLAKPMAARLMQLARPGQVLLSATAESMVRRAADSLGDIGRGLKWKSFGRWRFKGVAQPMDVFGVASPVVPAVGRPRATSKAIRDIPFWRRPMAMAAEATFAVVLVVGIWFLTRPQPAIAFVERDWVVLGTVRNLTGEPLLDDSLGQAFRMSLEQSRYVNVLGDLKVQDTLSRMRRPGESGLDRSAAIEVALRDGARAVIMPSVLEVHGKLRVAVEVVDPATGVTVSSYSADGRGLDSVLGSTDRVVASLRGGLGEALQHVTRDSVPLPKVATASLDALHAYAKGLAAIGDRDLASALLFFEQATAVDPGFAYAYIGMMRIRYAQGQMEQAHALYARARSLQDRLTPRERLYLQAWGARMEGASTQQVAERWRILASLYPDDMAGHMNYSLALFGMGRYQDALAASRHLMASQNPQRSYALNYIGRIHLALGNTPQALKTLDDAAAMDKGASDVWKGITYAAGQQFAETEKLFAGRALRDPGERIGRSSTLVDQQKFAEAYGLIREAHRQCGDVRDVCRILEIIALHQGRLAGEPVPASAYAAVLDGALAAIKEQDAAARRESTLFALAVAYHATRAGHPDVVRSRARTLAGLLGTSPDARSEQLWALVQATLAMEAGQPADALARLTPFIDGSELFQVRVALHAAYAGLGQRDAEAQQRRWLQLHRGLAYAEDAGGYLLQSLNLEDGSRIAGGGTSLPATH